MSASAEVRTSIEEPQKVRNYVPAWLDALCGARERAILQHPQARFLKEDKDGNRFPDHQVWVESPIGTMWTDSKARKILG